MFRFLLVLSLFGVTAGSLWGQGWERVYDGGGQGQINDIALAADGGFVMTGYYNSLNRARLFKTDADGYIQWTKDFFVGDQTSAEAVLVTKKGDYVIVGFARSISQPTRSFVLKTDKFGNKLWSYVFPSTYDAEATDVVELPDESLVVCGYQNNNTSKEDAHVFKLSANGALLWAKTFGELTDQEKAYAIATTPDGNVVVTGGKGPSSSRDIDLLKINAGSGALIWENTFGFFKVDDGAIADDVARDVIVAADGNIILAGRSTFDEGGIGLLMKVDGSGLKTILWKQSFSKVDFYGLAQTAAGGLLLTGSKSQGTHEDLYIVRTSPNGEKICDISVGRPGFDQGFAIVPTTDGGVAAAGFGELFVGTVLESNPYLVKADKNCVVFTSYISGHIYHDYNFDCKLEAGEPGLEDWIVRIESPNYTRYAAANANGDFEILADTGTYKIQLFPPNDSWETCDPVTPLNVTTFADTFPVDIPVHARSACPRNEVDIATPVLRRCADNTYTIRYCNSGTIPSLNTSIEVKLDPYLTFKNSSIPGTLLQDNTYSFNIGFLENGKCGSFTVTANLSCDNTIPGQAHCVTAHIFPDTFCNVADWDGSIVVAKAKCENNTVSLSLQNAGPGDMTTPAGFVIAEDVLMLTDPGNPMYQVQLNSKQEALVWSQLATGKTYRIIAKQTPGYPGTSYATAAVEGCRAPDSSSFTIGFYTMFPDDVDAFKSSDCQESNNADFNPDNLKRGHPKGYNTAHYVRPETDLEFLIQFQNPTTDTVHQVVIRDTLSPFLDPSTVHPGAASHPYDFDVYGNGIVQFTLPNLNLVPGSSASEGYVKFRVSQKPAIPCESKILNSAAIYYDFNAPVLSNQTFHTVCEFDTFVVVKTTNIEYEGAEVKIFPNPFDESAVFEISGVQASGYLLELYDLQGKKLFNQEYPYPTFRLHRQQLPAGMLFYRLTTDQGRPVASGKLLVR